VHQQVSRLEEEVGARLFDRVGKDRVALTVAGRALYEFVAPFYEQLPQVVAALGSGSLGGTLRIHASGQAIRHLLPGWLRRLQAKRPDIRVELSELRTTEVDLLRRGEADLLVDYLADIPEDVQTQRVGTVRAFLALPSHHRLARRKRVALSELAGESFVSYHADTRLRAMQLAVLAEQVPGARPTHAADSAEAILGFVAAGIGFSLVPSLLPRGPRVPGVRVLPLPPERSCFPIYAMFRRHADHPLVEAALKLAPG
jgi:DNA-binding transcriptional LysR family regulator